MQLPAALLHQQHLWRALSLSVSLARDVLPWWQQGYRWKEQQFCLMVKTHTRQTGTSWGGHRPTNSVVLPAVRIGPILWATGHSAVPSIRMDATIKHKYKLAFYLGFYKYSQIFCLGVDIYFFCVPLARLSIQILECQPQKPNPRA